MTKESAKRIIRRFNGNDNPTKEDEFEFTEACGFLIETENDGSAAVNLGGYYYEKQKYALAEKYYLKAFDLGDKYAADGLGYIYYYGRNGSVDYEKAFYYYGIAAKNGNKEAAMKIADMYRNGYGTEKNEKKYREMIEALYVKLKDTDRIFDPFPEVAHRYADILINEGRADETPEMLLRAKNIIKQRIRYNPFWGNFIVARRVVNILYSVTEPETSDMDFFDLFYYMKNPASATLYYEGKKYVIEAFYDEDAVRIKFEGKYYKSVEDFLLKAMVEGKHLYIMDYDDFYCLEGNEDE